MSFLSLKKPEKSYKFVLKAGFFGLFVNFILIIIFASIYSFFDKNENSIFKGMDKKTHRKFGDYLYFSVIINTTLGLGEIIPVNNGNPNDESFIKSKSISRVLVSIHILTSILVNNLLISFYDLKLSN